MKKHLYVSYRLLCLLFSLFIGLSQNANAQIISTVAGNGTEGYSGDGGPATAAEIYYPWSIACDASGGFFLGGYGYYYYGYGDVIRHVNSSGIIDVYAGNGTSGFSGDGGPATDAEIYSSGGVAADASGNLYIADYGNYRIRKVDASGIITTIAGNGISGYTGDGGPATDAEIGLSYYYGYDNGITSDPYGNIYIYVWGSWKIRKIDTAGIITTIAGNGTYGYSGDGGPATAAALGYLYGLAADGYGNIYLADYENNRVRMINSSGVISTVAGNGGSSYTGDGGPATAAEIGTAIGVAIDPAGNLNISDYSYHRVRKVNTAGIISTIAGTGAAGFSGDGGPATAAQLDYPEALSTDADGNVFIADYYNARIRKITNFNRPPRFTLRPYQNLVVCENSSPDSINALLTIIDSDLYQPETWAVLSPASHGFVTGVYTGASTGGVVSPHGLSYVPSLGYSGPDTFKMTICDGYAFDTIAVYVAVDPTPSTISGITSIAVGEYSLLGSTPSTGSWSSANPGIATVGATTGLVTGISSGTTTITYTLPTGCIMTNTLNVFSYAGMTIGTIAGNGTAGFSGDGAGALAAAINNPYGATEDASGNYYIADALNNRIRKVNTSGVISTLAGTGTPGSTGDGGPATAAQLYAPISVALDASGNLYFADQDNHKVRKISTSGVITTIAGTGSAGYTADGIAATASELNYPTAVTVDASGNVFIADQNNERIRKVNTSGIISTVAGNGTAGYTGDGAAATSKELNHPDGVAVDGLGNIYIADYSNSRVRMVNTSGIISTIAGSISGYSGDGSAAVSAELMGPFGIAVDALNNVYISDYTNNRVRKINTSGIISTIAGNGTAGYSGDACVATGGMLNGPSGLMADRSGNIIIADHSNNRIRRVSYNHAPKFAGGQNQSTSVCENSTDSLNGLLAITDIDNNQGETWGAITGALHGSLATYYTATSTGGSVTPVGLYYAPILGYTGLDSFKIMVADCSGGYDTTEIHVTVTPPPSSIVGASTVCPGLTTPFTDPVGTGMWSSSSILTASVGALSGIVTGVASGVAVITYSPGAGCSVTKTITVSAAPAAISGPSFVCQSQSVTLTDPTTGGSWSSSSSLATVSGTGVVTAGTTLGLVTITYLQGGCIATKTLSVNPVPPAITGLIAVCVGANTVLEDGGTGVWSTGTPLVATVDSFTGLVVGVSAGAPTITFTLPGGCFTTDGLIVSPDPLPIAGTETVCTGSTITMTDPSGGGVWSYFSIGTSAAKIDSATGIVTGYSSGTTTISYTDGGGCSATATITVNPSPKIINGSDTICIGGSKTLTDTTTGGTWSSSNSLVASVGTLSGAVLGVGSGYAYISYTVGGCSARDSVNVYAPPLPIVGPSTVCVGLTITLTDPTFGGTWTSGSPSVALIGGLTGIVGGFSSGSSVITYKSTTTGCSATKTVTVNSSPGPITGNTSICIGATSTLGNAVPGGTWLSSNPSVATAGASSGLITGVLTGTTTVTYSIGAGCSVSTIVTVNALPLPITGTASVCIGSATTLADPTPGGTWSSSVPANGSISTSGVVTGIAYGTSVVVYSVTATGCTRSVTVTVNPLPAVIGGPSAVCPGTTITLTETTGGGTWSSLTGSIATVVSSTGVVTGVATGVATIVYTLPTGCTRSKLVTVNPLPSAISGTTNVCVGSTITLTDGGGGTWSSGSATATVGTLSGIVTGVSAGPASISYTISTGCYVTSVITVNPLPSAISGPSALCAGATISLSDVGSGTWTSSVTTVATVNPTSGAVTGIITGTTLINYALPTGCSTAMTVTVSPSPLPIAGPSAVCAGATIALTDVIAGGLWTSSNTTAATVGSLTGIVTGGATAGLTTTITYSLGTGCTMTQVVSVSSSPAAITGNPNICLGATSLLSDITTGGTWSSSAATTASVSSTGLVTGAATGMATISYFAGGCPALLVVTVNPVPLAITGAATVCAGNTITDADPVAGGTWSTTGTSLSIAGSTGVITGIAGGSANITYAIGTCNAIRLITVNPIGPVTGLASLCTGTTTTLADGVGGGTWHSATASVATISGSGIVSGLTPGTSDITYTLGTGCMATATVTVSTGPSAIGGDLHVCVGTTSTLSNLMGGGTWSISPATTASIGTATGVVTGLIPGMATVTYSLGSGCTTFAVVTVNAAPSAITGASNVCLGATTPLADITPGGTWISGSEPIATISTTGVVLGVAAGTTTITYAAGGCNVTYPITVNTAPPAISGPVAICSGMEITYTDATPGGTWSSSNTMVVPIGTSTGDVTAGIAGMATITYSTGSGCGAILAVTVTAPAAAITGNPILCTGSPVALSDATPGGSWSSDNLPVATIDAITGIVTGSTPGTANISYTTGGCVATQAITVNLPPAAITGGPQICEHNLTTLSNPTTGGRWSSSNIYVASVDSITGMVNGSALGSVDITYSTGPGCSVVKTLTVIASPSAITGPEGICIGSSATVSDVTAGGIWSSSTPAIASITPAGVVTGFVGGMDTIIYTMPLTGCRSVLGLPVINLPAIGGPGSLCAWGDTIPVTDGYPGGIFVSSLVTVTNLGGGIGQVLANAPGIATVTYIIPAGCSVTRTLTVNALPDLIMGSYQLCAGISTTLTDATGGGMWSSSDSAIAAIAAGTGVATGVSGGTAYITYTLAATGCKTDTLVNVSTPPSAVSGSPDLCAGASTVFTDATPGGLWSSSTPAIAAVSGTGTVSGISSGAASITYSIGACTATSTVTVNPLPALFATTGGGNYCMGGAGAVVYLNGSQTGVNYQLYIGTTPVGSPVAGTGAILAMGAVTTGIYTVIATNATTSCSLAMAGSASVTPLPLPSVFSVTGGGGYCTGTSGIAVGLSGSATGISYQLYNGTSPSGLAMTGTGSSLSFGSITIAGTYTVKATNTATTCNDTMTGGATVSILPTVVPAVSIASSLGDTVCSGIPVLFSTTPVNGGITPAYQWKVNGTNTATTASYNYAPANGDVVSVVMTSNAACPLPATATNAITMTIVNVLTPVVTITASPGTTITTGQSVTFTATATTAGITPTYQWEVNGAAQSGATSSVFTSSTLGNGDIVTCVVTSEGQCGGHNGSGTVTMTVTTNSHVGVQQVTANGNNISVLPNPNKGDFTITGSLGSTADEVVTIEITDMLGQVVYKGSTQATGGKLNEHITLGKRAANGMYLLQLRSAGEGHVFHLVVEQ